MAQTTLPLPNGNRNTLQDKRCAIGQQSYTLELTRLLKLCLRAYADFAYAREPPRRLLILCKGGAEHGIQYPVATLVHEKLGWSDTVRLVRYRACSTLAVP